LSGTPCSDFGSGFSSAGADHDVEHAARDRPGEFVLEQVDERAEFLQPLLIALGQLELVARLDAFHARDRHEQVDEQALLDARVDRGRCRR
jgi:hypothetical protein